MDDQMSTYMIRIIDLIEEEESDKAKLESRHDEGVLI